MDSLTEIYLNQVVNPSVEEIQESPTVLGKQRKQSKRVAKYEIKKSAANEGIPLSAAYTQYMRRSHLPGDVKREIYFELDLGSFKTRKEENEIEYDVRVTSQHGKGSRTYTRKASDAEIDELKKKSNITSIEKISKTLDPVGKEDDDIDNDGDSDKSDKYLLNRRKVRSSAIKSMGESFSNWREDLKEIVKLDDTDKTKKFDVAKKKNKVTINPKLSKAYEEVSLSEMYEIDESDDLLLDFAYNVAESFYEQGYDENDVNNLAESLSSEEFLDLIANINEEFISEARRSGRIEPVTKTGKSVGSLKGGAKSAAINRLRKEKQARRDSEASASAAKPSGMTAALKSQSAIADKPKAKAPETKSHTTTAPKKKGALDRIAGAVLKGMERHKKATETAGRLARETGKTLSKAASVGSKAAKSFGSGVVSGAKDAATAAKKTKKAVVGEENDLNELKMPKIKLIKKGTGEKIVDFVKKGKQRHDQALAKRDVEKRERSIPRAALMASFSPEEIEKIEKIMEKAPSGAKYERMVKHIKKSYSEDGLTDKEKSIAYATAWKAKNKNKMKTEAIDPKINDLNTNVDDRVRKAQSDAVKKQQLANEKKLMDMRRRLELQRLQLQRQGKVPMGRAFESTEIEEGRDEDAQERRFQKHGDRSRGETATRLIGTASEKSDQLKRRQKKTRQDHPKHAELSRRIKSLSDRGKKLQQARSSDTSTFRQGPTEKSLKKN